MVVVRLRVEEVPLPGSGGDPIEGLTQTEAVNTLQQQFGGFEISCQVPRM